MTRRFPDPLANLSARGRIDRAQYLAAREFQKHFALADRRQLDSLTGEQLAAWKWLGKCYVRLGADGSALIIDVLIHARTAKQIAAARGMTGRERYFGKRLFEALNTLAEAYGFSDAENKIRAPGTKTQMIGAQ